MNYYQRKRFMKAAWLAHYKPGRVARRRAEDEPVTDAELNSMGLERSDLPEQPQPEPAKADTILPPPPDTQPDAVPPNLALILGYNPVDL